VAPRVAIVLFNLGGPDSPAAIKPFLRNLFLDPAILRVPFFVRPFLARVIARARVAPATANYALLGGKSPLLGLTQEQATALEAAELALDGRRVTAIGVERRDSAVNQRKFCTVVGTMDDSYRETPPTTEAGRNLAASIADLRRQLGCPS